jgi:hypothetical protein
MIMGGISGKHGIAGTCEVLQWGHISAAPNLASSLLCISQALAEIDVRSAISDVYHQTIDDDSAKSLRLRLDGQRYAVSAIEPTASLF